MHSKLKRGRARAGHSPIWLAGIAIGQGRVFEGLPSPVFNLSVLKWASLDWKPWEGREK